MAQPASVASSRIWLIEPAAGPHDDYWQDREIWARVVVSAPTAAQARLAAEHWAQQQPAPHVGNETPTPRAGFTDAKLYHAHEASPALAAAYAGASSRDTVLQADRLVVEGAREP